jgi:hypothetical protein
MAEHGILTWKPGLSSLIESGEPLSLSSWTASEWRGQSNCFSMQGEIEHKGLTQYARVRTLVGAQLHSGPSRDQLVKAVFAVGSDV